MDVPLLYRTRAKIFCLTWTHHSLMVHVVEVLPPVVLGVLTLWKERNV